MVMINELDRCRPSYAVELLEVAKHLFSADRIVFVLAVNCDQLAHSVTALYGNDFDAEGYLRRFFDVDFQLPEPDRRCSSVPNSRQPGSPTISIRFRKPLVLRMRWTSAFFEAVV